MSANTQLIDSSLGTLISGTSYQNHYAEKLLADIGVGSKITDTLPGPHPALRWSQSGLMSLTGCPDSAPQLCPVPLASCADAVVMVLQQLAGKPLPNNVSGAGLMTERAAITGHRRGGHISPGGSCCILPTQDGHIGLNLARDPDWGLMPAWLCPDIQLDWGSVEAFIARLPSKELVERGRLLGLAVVDADSHTVASDRWFEVVHRGKGLPERRNAPRVLDLSSLWAGPLCGHLLHCLGAEVTKLESTQRPDGARKGSSTFFNLLNQGKQSVVLDLHTATGQQQLRELMATVDIVIESTRPRALRQMGIVAEDVIDQNPGLSWISITGYGRQEPQANWIAYGDDAGVAAGLSAIMHRVSGQWTICGDAIADSLTGMHAALAAWASWKEGGGHLIDLSLLRTLEHCIAQTQPADGDYSRRYESWNQWLRDKAITAADPQARTIRSSAA